MAFKQGQSGNPGGRPPGIRDKRTALRELLLPHADALVGKAVEQALAGDTSALRICIDRIIPAAKVKDDPVQLPSLDGSLAGNAKVVVAALGAGELSPDEAATILGALATQVRIVEVDEMEKRITALEKGTNGKP